MIESYEALLLNPKPAVDFQTFVIYLIALLLPSLFIAWFVAFLYVHLGFFHDERIDAALRAHIAWAWGFIFSSFLMTLAIFLIAYRSIVPLYWLALLPHWVVTVACWLIALGSAATVRQEVRVMDNVLRTIRKKS